MIIYFNNIYINNTTSTYTYKYYNINNIIIGILIIGAGSALLVVLPLNYL